MGRGNHTEIPGVLGPDVGRHTWDPDEHGFTPPVPPRTSTLDPVSMKYVQVTEGHLHHGRQEVGILAEGRTPDTESSDVYEHTLGPYV